MGTVCATIVVPARLDSVPQDLAVAVVALGCERVNGALEAVENMPATREKDLEGLVVVVSADLTDRHRNQLATAEAVGRETSQHSSRLESNEADRLVDRASAPIGIAPQSWLTNICATSRRPFSGVQQAGFGVMTSGLSLTHVLD